MNLNRPLGYQLYSSRNFGPPSATLTMLAELGYTHVEGYGALLADAGQCDALAAALDGAGLTMPTAHIGLETLEADLEGVLALAERFKIDTIFIPYLAPEDRPTDADGWRAVGARVAKLGKPLLESGLALGWHNHDFEFVRLASGEMPIELVFEAADFLRFEFDLAWAQRAGEDPSIWIDRFAGRIAAVHVKDIAPDGENLDEDGWADIGAGTMSWADLLERLSERTQARLIVEHDNPSDDHRFAKHSLRAIATMRVQETA